jgi:hypothetical protein
VQVLTDLNAMLGPEEVGDWQALCQELLAGEETASGAPT